MTITTSATKSSTTAPDAVSEDTYFNLPVTGIGYVNRIRTVKPKIGDSFTSCSIGALRGKAGQNLKTYFDVKIVGAEALDVIKRADAYVTSNELKDAKVLISFRIGDIEPESFEYASGPKKGQIGLCIKGRLLKIFWVDINGKRVYDAPKVDANQDADSDAKTSSESSEPDAPSLKTASQQNEPELANCF